MSENKIKNTLPGERNKKLRPTIRLRDWLFSPFFCLSLLGVLIYFEFIQRIAIRRSPLHHRDSVFRLNRAFVKVLTLFGIQINVISFAKLDPKKPYILISNHQSLFDTPILHTIFAEHYPRYIAKKELSRSLPSVSFNLRHGGSAIIDRDNAQQAIEEIKKLGTRMVEENFATVLFPEGTRAKDGALKRFRPAGLAALLQAAPEAEIVPVTLDGPWKLARKLFPLPLATEITVVIGAPFPQVPGQSLKEISHEVHELIARNLQSIRDGKFIQEHQNLQQNLPSHYKI